MNATLGHVTTEDRDAFALALNKAKAEDVNTSGRVIDGAEVIWAPLPGSQTAALSCPLFELLYHGTRGPGKTDALLMMFAQHVGKHGAAWRGIIFRQTYPQLADVVAKSEKWFRQIFPDARFNRAQMRWEWPTGETLAFRHMGRPDDYWNYHGHEYPFIGWEELTNWPTDECYRTMFACCRSSTPGVPKMIRATTNPYGVGHSWVKQRWKLHGKWWTTITQLEPKDADGNVEPPRVAIHGHIDENYLLLEADPKYKENIAAASRNKAMLKAWRDGSWEFVAGGMFDDVWDSDANVVQPFEIPDTWRIDRAFDWGSSKPFSVGWWAESDGSDVRLANGQVASTVKGDLFRVREWYGSTGRPNDGLRMLAVDVAKGIVEREVMWGWRKGSWCRVSAGPADSSIFTVENGMSIASDMARPVRLGALVYPGVKWRRADKRPGSRVSGWEMMRKMMRNVDRKGGPRERPGLFVFDGYCEDFLRTVVVLPRDSKNLDDVDTDSEDHIGDETRYRVRFADTPSASGSHDGMN